VKSKKRQLSHEEMQFNKHFKSCYARIFKLVGSDVIRLIGTFLHPDELVRLSITNKMLSSALADARYFRERVLFCENCKYTNMCKFVVSFDCPAYSRNCICDEAYANWWDSQHRCLGEFTHIGCVDCGWNVGICNRINCICKDRSVVHRLFSDEELKFVNDNIASGRTYAGFPIKE
jgi:hypothetical protein